MKRETKTQTPPAQANAKRAPEPVREWWTWLASIAPTAPSTQCR